MVTESEKLIIMYNKAVWHIQTETLSDGRL